MAGAPFGWATWGSRCLWGGRDRASRAFDVEDYALFTVKAWDGDKIEAKAAGPSQGQEVESAKIEAEAGPVAGWSLIGNENVESIISAVSK